MRPSTTTPSTATTVTPSTTTLTTVTLTTIGVSQLVLGLAFLIAPTAVAELLGFEPSAPGWARWLFAMMAARFLGYAYGMLWSARHPEGAGPWIDTMIVVQAIDWIATLAFLRSGAVTLGQVTTASFLPVLFIAALVRIRPGGAGSTPSPDGATGGERPTVATTGDPLVEPGAASLVERSVAPWPIQRT